MPEECFLAFCGARKRSFGLVSPAFMGFSGGFGIFLNLVGFMECSYFSVLWVVFWRSISLKFSISKDISNSKYLYIF